MFRKYDESPLPERDRKPLPPRKPERAFPAVGVVLIAVAVALMMLFSRHANAAGVLTATGSPAQPIRIADHHLDVTINNGFARTQVTQTFHNPNAADLEAVYSFPVPKSASLSEVSITIGEKQIDGEVVPRQKAESVYEEEKANGNDAGLAVKNAFYTYDFAVSRVPANGDATIRFVYYQPLEIDTGVGRYVYPLEEGGTDDAAQSFWTANAKVDNAFGATFDLKSAVPVTDVRLPGAPDAVATQIDPGHWTVKLDRAGGELNKDLILYYKLADNLPGRIEVIPYRADSKKPGTFMAILTPGADLKPLDGGADYTFVLDTSGSMAGKIATLADGVAKVIGQLNPSDHFRVISFSTAAREVVPTSAATPENVKAAIAAVSALQTGGGTNLFDAIRLALGGLDDDRATSIILVTDGVTNAGTVDPAAFDQLLRTRDVRVFGFLLGNSANWPLMRTICDASGGFYAGVSNQDDLVGQILLAKSKVNYEAMTDARVTVQGAGAEDVTERTLGKVYRGQQVVMFGRYAKAGPANIIFKARLTSGEKTYSAAVDFPETDTSNPEVERLWAMDRIEQLQADRDAGRSSEPEVATAVCDLGVAYQLVTDETAMLVLDNAAFERHGIARDNRQRSQVETAAQSARAQQPAQDRRVDREQPAFSQPAPRLPTGNNGSGGHGGGGAVGPYAVSAGVAFALLAWAGGAFKRREAV